MEEDKAPKSSRGWRRSAFRAGALMLLLAVGAAMAKLLSGVVRPQGTIDIPYADGERHKLDVYRPRGAAGAGAPVIVFFYGGSWQSGAKGTYRLLAATLAGRGYVVVVPDYRLYPEVRFPDFLTDGAKALRWTRYNIAAFHGDARRLFVMGHSAGAYIAAMLALDGEWLKEDGLDPNRDIAGLIGVSGPYDFLPLRDPILSIIFGGNNRPVTQPISYAEGRKPPALLLTGAADETVSPGNSARLAAKLRQGGNDATDRTYPHFSHTTIMAAFAPIVATFLSPLDDLDAFVRRIRPGARQNASIPAEVPAP
jgi:acetyl esterase/lipase